MKIIEREEILRRLTPAWCIGLMRDCLSQLEEGRAVQYLRTVTPLPSGDIMGYMPAAVSGAFGAKVITVFHHNSEKGLPSHQGSVLLFDGETGTLQAMLDGGAITEIRTGAASAVATDLLARPDAEVLALIGSGAKARSHLLAIREIRKLREVRVWSPSLESDTRFAREMGELTGLPVRICASAKEAAEGADILCTLTPSKTPGAGAGMAEARRPCERRGSLFGGRPGTDRRAGAGQRLLLRQRRVGDGRERRLPDPAAGGALWRGASPGHPGRTAAGQEARTHLPRGDYRL